MKSAGFSGLIIPDLPVEEASDCISSSREEEIDLIFLVTPASSDQRIQVITEASSGFIYCVTLTGTTGTRLHLPANLPRFLSRVRQFTDTPIAAGFGISSAEQIDQLKPHTDGIIVGSRFIEAVRKQESLTELVKELKSACQHE
jgi:tryptophan synthase alpha chain